MILTEYNNLSAAVEFDSNSSRTAVVWDGYERTVPWPLNLLHETMKFHFSGSPTPPSPPTPPEPIYVVEIIDNELYVNGTNTHLNVKGDPGESAYEIYVRLQKEKGEPYYETEQEWIDALNAYSERAGEAERADGITWATF